MEENVRINITGDNRDALKKLNKVEQAVDRINAASNKVEIRVSNIKETETQINSLYNSLQRLENVALSKLPQSLQTVIVYLKAANRGFAELTARAAMAASVVGQIGVIDFSPTIRQLKAANDRVDELIRKRRFLQGQIRGIDTRIDKGTLKRPEAIQRARQEQERLRELVRKFNVEIEGYNSKALTGYRAQSSALRALANDYEAVRRALVSLRIEQVRVFEINQKRLRQQGDLPGTGQQKRLPPGGVITKPLNAALQKLTEIIYVSVGQIGRIWQSSRLLPPARTGLPEGSDGGGPFTPRRAPQPYAMGPAGRLVRRETPEPQVNNIKRLEAFARALNKAVKAAEIGSPAFARYSQALGRVKTAIDAAYRDVATLQAQPGTLKGKRAEAENIRASLEEAEIGSKRFNDLAKSLGKVNAEIERTERKVSGRGIRSRGGRQRLGDAASGAILGGGFPLLTGGPSFSALGGGALGGIGGFAFGATGGFAGGIAGSAIGAAIDTFVQKAQELGKALLNPTDNLDALVESLGILGSASSSLITELKALGATEIAAAVATEELTARLATAGVDTENFKKDTANLDNALKDLQLVFTAWAAKFIPFIQGITSFVSGFVGGNFSSSQAVEGSAQASNAVSEAEAARNKILRDSLNVEKQIVSNKEQELSISSIQRATLEGNLNLQKNQAQLDKLQLRLYFEQNTTKQRLLKNEIEITKERRRQLRLDAEAARDRAIQQTVRTAAGEDVQRDAIRARNLEAVAQTLSTLTTFGGTISNAAAELEGADFDLYQKKLFAIEETARAEKDRINQAIDNNRVEFNLDETVRKRREERLKAERELNNTIEQQKKRNLEIEFGQYQLEQQRFNLQLKMAQIGKRQELERVQLSSPAALFQDAGAGIGFFQDTMTLARTQTLEFAQTLETLDTQIQTFETSRAKLKLTGKSTEDLDRQIKQLKSVRQTYTEIQPAINQAQLEQQRFNDALQLATPIVSSFINGISEVVQGTKTAQEAFADFLRTIGDTLVQEGTRMIATYIAIGIAKAFAGLSGGTTDMGSKMSNTQYFNPNTGLGVAGPNFGLANGGPAKAGQPYMVGERGPELFVPSTNGGVLRNEDLRSAMSRQQSSAPAMNFSFETTNIGGTEYVSREQLEAAMAVTRKQAANDGAKRGMNMTLDKMQHSPATRRRVGI